MKIVILFIVIAMIPITFNSTMFAEDCSQSVTGCQWSDWQADTQLQGMIPLDIPPNCKVWVSYSIRTVYCPPETVHEISINSIEKNGCTIPDLDVFQNAVKALLFASPKIFGTGSNNINVRVKLPACFRWNGNSVSWGPSATECSCCSRLYNLTPNSNYVQIISSIPDPFDPDPPCPVNFEGGCYENSSCALSAIPNGPVVFPSVYPECPDPGCTNNWDVNPRYLAYTGKRGPDPNPCEFTIYYQKKVCSNADMKLRIVKIVANTNCGSYGADDIFRKAVKRILYHAGEIFNITGTETVHFMSPRCWKANTIGTYKIYEPCDEEMCCEWDYEINTNLLPPELNDVDAGTTMGGSCSAWLNGDNCTEIRPCFNDVLTLPLGDLPDENNRLPKQAVFGLENEQALSQYTSISFVVPNPADDKIDIHLKSPGKGLAKIIIFNSQGSIVHKVSYEKSSFESITSLETGQFSNGIYSYCIFLNGKVTVSGKFVILR